jgi:redox-sensitive bicupin YhaK (pirin superfamily)
MIGIRRGDNRGHFEQEWLETWHSFSFGDYYDPAHMGFGPLTVINEDWVHPGCGFPPHEHSETEIFSYVLAGTLEYRDSLGNAYLLSPGDAQLCSAGSGVLHSVYNASPNEIMGVLQFWVLPQEKGAPPLLQHWETRSAVKNGGLALIASPEGRNGSMRIHQSVDIYSSVIEPGQMVGHALRPGRHGWLQVAHGHVMINGEPLAAGDGAAIIDEQTLDFEGLPDGAEVLLFDIG